MNAVAAWRRPGRRAARLVRYGQKLNCLKPNPERRNVHAHRDDAWNRCHVMPGPWYWALATSGTWASPSEGGQGDEWVAYVALDTYGEDVPRDRLQGASPMATECP